MLRAGVALLALLVPSVLPCKVHVGNQRAATLSKDPQIHVHVVVFGKVYCASRPDLLEAPPLEVTLDVGVRQADPSRYQLLSNATFGAGPGDLEFALTGDYSYPLFSMCITPQPRVSVKDFCGEKVLDDIKPTYERELGGKNRLMKVYDLGQIRPGPHAGPYN